MNVTGIARRLQGCPPSAGTTRAWRQLREWDLVREGLLVGYQLDRAGAAPRVERSNGCAYGDAATSVPLQRMPNVRCGPTPGPTCWFGRRRDRWGARCRG